MNEWVTLSKGDAPGTLMPGVSQTQSPVLEDKCEFAFNPDLLYCWPKLRGA